MDPILELLLLIKQTVVPSLDSLVDEVKNLAKDMQEIRLLRQKDAGKIENLEEKTRILEVKCGEITDIARGLGSRTAKLEERMEAGHKQNAECRQKNKQVDEALRLAKENKRKNEEQEKRHIEMLADQKEKNKNLINKLWVLIVALVSAAAAGWFNHFWTISKGGGV